MKLRSRAASTLCSLASLLPAVRSACYTTVLKRRRHLASETTIIFCLRVKRRHANPRPNSIQYAFNGLLAKINSSCDAFAKCANRDFWLLIMFAVDGKRGAVNIARATRNKNSRSRRLRGEGPRRDLRRNRAAGIALGAVAPTLVAYRLSTRNRAAGKSASNSRQRAAPEVSTKGVCIINEAAVVVEEASSA